jgi:voltage-gated potassium channel
MPDRTRDLAPWRKTLHEVIFEADTPGGKGFDVALLVAIITSVIVVCLDSVASIRETHGAALLAVEWLLTAAFTIEYVLRLACVRSPARYAVSFFGVIDLMAILPTYLLLFDVSVQSLLVIRVLRLMRVFRVFKLVHFIGEAQALRAALRSSVYKITVFMLAVLSIMLILGTTMYLVEGEGSGFTNIPQSVYWAIVTMTTVGYGDITPQTITGKLVASFMMMLGYAIIAVPTGIVTVELGRSRKRTVSAQACPKCGVDGHDSDARYCRLCASRL